MVDSINSTIVEDEIQSRIRLYDFSTGTQTFFEWQAGMLPAMAGKRVLELGCGNGEFWRPLLPRWTDCDLMLTDVSAELVESAKTWFEPFLDMTKTLAFDVIDFNELALEEGSFDVIIANHNLFYAKDLPKVLANIQTLLSPGGRLICSTVGHDHLKELVELLRHLKPNLPWAAESWSTSFGLETGCKTLLHHFQQVDQFEYDNCLHVSSVDPIISYLKKTMKRSLNPWVCEHETDIREALTQNLQQHGYVRLTPHSGFFVAQKSL